MTSKPLFMRVAESIVMRPPILQVGWSRACSAVTDSSSSAARPRKGPPEAVRMPATTRSRGTPSRSWNIAECSESTGTRAAPVRARAALTSSPPTTRLSLLASATGRPRSSAARVGGRPAAPTIPFSTTSGSLASMRSPWSRPPPWEVCATRGPPPARPSRRPGCRTPGRSRSCRGPPRSPGGPARRWTPCSRGRGRGSRKRV